VHQVFLQRVQNITAVAGSCPLPELVLLRRRRGLCRSRRLAVSGLRKAKRLERRGPRLPRKGTGVCQHSHAATASTISKPGRKTGTMRIALVAQVTNKQIKRRQVESRKSKSEY